VAEHAMAPIVDVLNCSGLAGSDAVVNCMRSRPTSEVRMAAVAFEVGSWSSRLCQVLAAANTAHLFDERGLGSFPDCDTCHGPHLGLELPGIAIVDGTSPLPISSLTCSVPS
jgi:hypothetical protein